MLKLRLRDRPELFALAVIAVGIPGQHDLLILDMQPALIQPDRHALARQAAFGVDVEALNADIPGAIDRALIRRMSVSLSEPVSSMPGILLVSRGGGLAPSTT